MLPDIVDCREQFPLRQKYSVHELSIYFPMRQWPQLPGTLEIARVQQVKHPKVYSAGRSADWVMTTDLLLTLKRAGCELELLAIAIKMDGEITKERTRQLLAIERQYWLERGVQWLLITPSTYHSLFADALRNCVSWSLGAEVDTAAIDYVALNQEKWAGRSVTDVLSKLAVEFNSYERAQRALWQAAWSARLPLDFRRGWRPHEPIVLISESDFWGLNPIASRRSAWKA
ncbi:TnsA endonuclease N-terminal domain-containing protein [Collimonas fungivorans]|uniref:TnsA endonuclease N-terminal domain-containing protein n=1 Tax=Collimonas fungivorans TaxID=158899 RepID=UPI001F1CF2CA|nr:TnsA endonuclease N-terminal domain-containing protein [Collimonas fungivorans]